MYRTIFSRAYRNLLANTRCGQIIAKEMSPLSFTPAATRNYSNNENSGTIPKSRIYTRTGDTGLFFLFLFSQILKVLLPFTLVRGYQKHIISSTPWEIMMNLQASLV